MPDPTGSGIHSTNLIQDQISLYRLSAFKVQAVIQLNPNYKNLFETHEIFYYEISGFICIISFSKVNDGAA